MNDAAPERASEGRKRAAGAPNRAALPAGRISRTKQGPATPSAGRRLTSAFAWRIPRNPRGAGGSVRHGAHMGAAAR
jgi:hypothetical protein